MKVFILTALRCNSTAGNENQGAYTYLFRPELVALNTILTSVSLFGTSKYDIREKTLPGQIIFSLTLFTTSLSLDSDCFVLQLGSLPITQTLGQSLASISDPIPISKRRVWINFSISIWNSLLFV